ncbi:hypothetical protein C4J81_01755 [Deltaproteobacteria bacterium Smac51]|nr:hypothetical protein C4J81_01755 [Deltaproteobacteria bacterium Smac51]
MPEPTRPTPSKATALSSPARLYTRGNFYYFRVVLPNLANDAASIRREIRLSLHTGYKQEARKLSQALYAHLWAIMKDDPMIDYPEIKRRMNQYLQKLLADDHQDLHSQRTCGSSPLNLTHGEIGLYHAGQMLYGVNDPAKLDAVAEKIIPLLIEEGFLKDDEVTDDNRLSITKEFAKTYISYLQILERREKGDFMAELPAFAYPAPPQPTTVVTYQQTNSAAEKVDKEPAPIVSVVMEKYINTKISDGHWKTQTIADHKNRLSTLLEIIPDKPIDEITRDDMRKFRDTIRKLPPNRGRSAKYRDKTIAELLAMNIPQEETLNVKTVNVITSELASFFEWCIREGILSANPATGLQIKDDRQAIELRDAFTMDDLRLIFSHKKFTQGKFKFPAYFWIPLIGLFTGMRLEEISQLQCSDIIQINDLWIIDVNDKGKDEHGFNKSLKTGNARRLIPIHDELVKLGLLKYHEQIQARGHIRLFPELTKTNQAGKYGKQPGKQFKAVVVDVLKDADKKSFHSLRHTFADFYKQRGWQTDIFRQLYAHDIPELASKQYGSKFPPDLLYKEIISKLDYNLDLSNLTPILS